MEFDKVKEIIAEQMSISEDEITMETSFADDLGADSLDLFQIISELEESFEIEFANEDAEKIKTVGDAVEYIKNAKNK
ncbi:MAG: acyl carrier protein [Firmicutes bacterium]|nr:acyl carrier protein [Bacillota bacterium]